MVISLSMKPFSLSRWPSTMPPSLTGIRWRRCARGKRGRRARVTSNLEKVERSIRPTRSRTASASALYGIPPVRSPEGDSARLARLRRTSARAPSRTPARTARRALFSLSCSDGRAGRGRPCAARPACSSSTCDGSRRCRLRACSPVRRPIAEAARIEFAHVDFGLAVHHPLRQILAGAAALADADRGAAVHPVVLRAMRRAGEIDAIRRVRDRARDHRLDARLREQGEPLRGPFEPGHEAIELGRHQFAFEVPARRVSIPTHMRCRGFVGADQDAVGLFAQIAWL